VTNHQLPPPKPEQQYIYAKNWRYPSGSRFIKKYGWPRILIFLGESVVVLVFAAAVFGGAYQERPRGTGEVLQMTLGAGLLFLLALLLLLGAVGLLRGRNPRRQRLTPAGWYPDPWGVDFLRWFNNTEWTDDTANRGGRNPAATTNPSSPPGGWYQDPAGSGRLRYFTGTGWTDYYSPAMTGRVEQPPSR
jgi:Protein of unknown function (DUF2510)